MMMFSRLLSALLLLGSFGAALPVLGQTASPSPTPFQPIYLNSEIRFTNNSGFDDSKIFVSFNNPIVQTSTAQKYGNTEFGSSPDAMQYGQPWQNAPLSDFNVSAAGQDPVYKLELNNFTGRMFVSYGAGSVITEPVVNTTMAPFVLFEFTINGLQNTATATVNSNMDISYVNYVSAPATVTLRSADGSVQQLQTINPINTDADILSNVESAVPTDALLIAGPADKQRVVRVLAPISDQSPYHDWTSLMDKLADKDGNYQSPVTLNIGSFTIPSDDSLFQYALSGVQVLFGGPGVTYSPQLSGFTNPQQTYSGTAVFDAEKVTLSMSSPDAGSFTIEVQRSELNKDTGIYGQNPGYTVKNTSQTYTTSNLQNDLGGWIVGDLMAGMTFGWAACEKTVSELNSMSEKTLTDLDKLFDATQLAKKINELNTSEFFALVSLAGAQGKASEWTGQGLLPTTKDAPKNALFYDVYGDAVTQNSAAYGYAFGDRFKGLYNPNIFWYLANPPASNRVAVNPPNFPVLGYIELDLQKVSLPKPSDLLSRGERVGPNLFQLGSFGTVNTGYWYNDFDIGWLHFSEDDLGWVFGIWKGGVLYFVVAEGGEGLYATTPNFYPAIFSYRENAWVEFD